MIMMITKMTIAQASRRMSKTKVFYTFCAASRTAAQVAVVPH
jgi:hypothetical protein